MRSSTKTLKKQALVVRFGTTQGLEDPCLGQIHTREMSHSSSSYKKVHNFSFGYSTIPPHHGKQKESNMGDHVPKYEDNMQVGRYLISLEA